MRSVIAQYKSPTHFCTAVLIAVATLLKKKAMEYWLLLSLFLLTTQFPPPTAGDYLLEIRVHNPISAASFCLLPAGSTYDGDCPYGGEVTEDGGTGDLGTAALTLTTLPVSLSDYMGMGMQCR